jgi:hypothetical protein
MNSITEDSHSHERDGIDPDAPKWCNNAAQDVKELQGMSEADKAHYASTPGGVKAYIHIKR